MQSKRRRRRRRHDPARARAHGPLGAGRRRRGSPRPVAAACGIADIITVDIGWHKRRHLPDQRTAKSRSPSAAMSANGRCTLPMVDMVTIGAGGGSIARAIGRRPHGRTAEWPVPIPAPRPTAVAAKRPRSPTPMSCWANLPAKSFGLAGWRSTRSAARRAIEAAWSRPRWASRPKRPRAAFWPSSTTTWWARCASFRSSAATIRAISPWCRSGGAGPLHGCALAELLGITRVPDPSGARRPVRRRTFGSRSEGRFQPNPAKAGPIDLSVAARDL